VAIESDLKYALLALNRFGYGARGTGNDLAAAAQDPRGLLKVELDQPDVALAKDASLPSSQDALQALFAERQRVQEMRQKGSAQQTDAAPAKPPDPEPSASKTVTPPDMTQDGSKPDPKAKAEQPVPQQLFRAEALVRFRKAAAAETGYVERLVQFWSNHFCVSATKGGLVRATAGSFEREAIRPHVLGRFGDMLRSVVQHPAMLAYLDNAQSFGPTSTAGLRQKRGLNENLAREILELHTLGVVGGYTQADVTSLAQILTGWTFSGAQGRAGEPGVFTFFARAHEPGDRMLLGKRYKAAGIEQGEAALADLARHPSTARHIATKLAQHFVADAPPAALVDRLAAVFKSTDGDLKALAVALVDDDEAWTVSHAKIRSPYEFLMAAVRAIGHVPEDVRILLAPLVFMGMPLWQPPGPNGWPDTTAAWATPKGMKSRLDMSAAIAARAKDIANPRQLIEACLGQTASAETRQAIARAESRQQGIALLLMSPEFQWR
jgi:uncharacterized protein (DUF1800 family)